MPEIFDNINYLISRYLHIVCTTILVGGTLFYEMVVPVAIDDLKHVQQLSVFARARWMFRSLVWLSAAILIITGVTTTMKHWSAYTQESQVRVQTSESQPRAEPIPVVQRSGWWWAAHASTGGIAVLIALFLTYGPRPPERPVLWMRMNLIILLVVIFLASATRHVRLLLEEREEAANSLPYYRPPFLPPQNPTIMPNPEAAK